MTFLPCSSDSYDFDYLATCWLLSCREAQFPSQLLPINYLRLTFLANSASGKWIVSKNPENVVPPLILWLVFHALSQSYLTTTEKHICSHLTFSKPAKRIAYIWAFTSWASSDLINRIIPNRVHEVQSQSFPVHAVFLRFSLLEPSFLPFFSRSSV